MVVDEKLDLNQIVSSSNMVSSLRLKNQLICRNKCNMISKPLGIDVHDAWEVVGFGNARRSIRYS